MASPKTDQPSTQGATDYASELLGGFSTTPAGAATGRQTQRVTRLPKARALDDLPIANRDSMEGTATFGTLTRAATVDDPQTRLRIFARARFPNLPEAEALSRVGTVGNEVIYLGDDGKIYRDTPPGLLGGAKELGASIVGRPLTTAGATIGGIVGAAGGPLGAAGGATLGAAGGRGFEKVYTNVAEGEPQTVGGNVRSMATEGGFAGGGSLMGSAIGKVLERGMARDIRRLDPTKVSEITAKATREGIDLNAAQATNLPSLKAKFDTLSVMPTSRDIISEGAERQSRQSASAVERFLQRVSPAEGLDEAGIAARDAAKRVISDLVEDRSSKARPLYEAAFQRAEQAGGIPPEIMAQARSLMERPAMIEAGKKAVQIAKNEGIDLADPRQSLKGMHYMKLALGDMIGAPKEGLGKVERAQFTNLKNQLVRIMDDLSPDYAEARKVFAHYSPAVNDIKEGIVSRLADMTDETAFKAAQTVFGGNLSPKTVQRTRELFMRSGMTEQWDGLLRAYLQKTWEQAGKQTMTGGGAITQAPKWRAMLWGSPQQKRILEASMEPGQRAAMGDLMDVFEAVARTASAGQGSQTMPRMEGARLLREEAGSSMLSKGATALSPQTIGTRLSNYLDEVKLGKHAEKLAEIITSKDGINKLRELKRLSPNDKRFIQGASTLFGVTMSPRAPGAVE